jgi:HEAT repeat protein
MGTAARPAVPALLALIRAEPDGYVRTSAITALRKIDPKALSRP